MSKLLLPPVEGRLREVRLLADRLDAAFTPVRFPQNPDLVFRRISFAFHRLVLSSAQTNTSPGPEKLSHVTLTFEIKPESYPPTNIHVLIGRNGVGKTRTLNLMSRSLFANENTSKSTGKFQTGIKELTDEIPFANMVSVSFSAFDDFELLSEQRDKSSGVHYTYIGLRRTTNLGSEKGTPKTPDMLAREFVSSVNACLSGATRERWRRSLEILETDPIFKEAEIAQLSELTDLKELDKEAVSKFRKLSSGHKIVLLSITRLVESVEEKTLVLLDE
ncbi:MAG TPA: ATP-binding cassette domain-containing protein, partial [Dongiaceae bacterium]|nr:ATP-binding cassette domain-containing protein [Dongiaceae bacterium]